MTTDNPTTQDASPRYRPAANLFETAEHYQLELDVPGVPTDELRVDFEDGVLTVLGPVPAPDGEARPLLTEFGQGDFYRSFRLSENIDASSIAAHYALGVLTLTLPKSQASMPRQITVSAG